PVSDQLALVVVAQPRAGEQREVADGAARVGELVRRRARIRFRSACGRHSPRQPDAGSGDRDCEYETAQRPTGRRGGTYRRADAPGGIAHGRGPRAQLQADALAEGMTSDPTIKKRAWVRQTRCARTVCLLVFATRAAGSNGTSSLRRSRCSP